MHSSESGEEEFIGHIEKIITSTVQQYKLGSITCTNSDDNSSAPGFANNASSSMEVHEGHNKKKASFYAGKWTVEEENFVKQLIEEFQAGYLALPDGTSLRQFLARMLRCRPKRISKKFEGSNYAKGKKFFVKSAGRIPRQEAQARSQRLCELERRYKASKRASAEGQRHDETGRDEILSKSLFDVHIKDGQVPELVDPRVAPSLAAGTGGGPSNEQQFPLINTATFPSQRGTLSQGLWVQTLARLKSQQAASQQRLLTSMTQSRDYNQATWHTHPSLAQLMNYLPEGSVTRNDSQQLLMRLQQPHPQGQFQDSSAVSLIHNMLRERQPQIPSSTRAPTDLVNMLGARDPEVWRSLLQQQSLSASGSHAESTARQGIQHNINAAAAAEQQRNNRRWSSAEEQLMNPLYMASNVSATVPEGRTNQQSRALQEMQLRRLLGGNQNDAAIRSFSEQGLSSNNKIGARLLGQLSSEQPISSETSDMLSASSFLDQSRTHQLLRQQQLSQQQQQAESNNARRSSLELVEQQCRWQASLTGGLASSLPLSQDYRYLLRRFCGNSDQQRQSGPWQPLQRQLGPTDSENRTGNAPLEQSGDYNTRLTSTPELSDLLRPSQPPNNAVETQSLNLRRKKHDTSQTDKSKQHREQTKEGTTSDTKKLSTKKRRIQE